MQKIRELILPTRTKAATTKISKNRRGWKFAKRKSSKTSIKAGDCFHLKFMIHCFHAFNCNKNKIDREKVGRKRKEQKSK